jgi:hypothetical protein
VYIDSDGLIRGCEFDEDSEEWDEAELEGLGDVKAHDERHLSVAEIPGYNIVLFQDTDGSIQTIKHDHDSDRWSSHFAVPGDAASGTPIAGFATDKALVVSFIEDDGMIHAHSRDFATGDWTGK